MTQQLHSDQHRTKTVFLCLINWFLEQRCLQGRNLIEKVYNKKKDYSLIWSIKQSFFSLQQKPEKSNPNTDFLDIFLFQVNIEFMTTKLVDSILLVLWKHQLIQRKTQILHRGKCSGLLQKNNHVIMFYAF